jgi:hypothetical protein
MLVLAVVFAAANFVLVDLRLFVVTIQLRLAWVVLVPALLTLALGWHLGRTRLGAGEPDPDAPRASEATVLTVPGGDRRQRQQGEGDA